MIVINCEADKNPKKVAEANSKVDKEQLKQGWLAPKLYDPILADAYTEASDAHQSCMIHFWQMLIQRQAMYTC